MNENKWKFCYANHCWWVIIDNIEQFLEYKDKTNSKYGHALVKGIYGEDNPYQQLYDAAEVIAKNYETSLVGGMSVLASQMLETQMNAVLAGHTLWFNDKGGYNYGLDTQKTATVYRDKLVFPNYTKKDIRISKWGMVSRSGEVIINPSYVGAKSYSNSLAAISNGETWGFINQSGELVIDYQFHFADYFTDKGLCAVSTTGHDYVFIQLKYIDD